MSKCYYARFKEFKDEIRVFQTESERDEWVNFSDQFYDRIPVTEKQANYIIKTFGLEKVETEDLFGEKVTMYVKTNEGEQKVMKKQSKVSLEPTMEIRARKILAGATVKNAQTVGTKVFAWVPVELMNVAEYQRESHKVQKIAENWDDDRCDVLTVSYDEENGWFNIIDGQHRCIAAKMRGVEYLVCEIRQNLSISDEANLFVDMNTNSKHLNPYDTFKANLYISEKDETATSRLDKRIDKVCREYDVKVYKSQACGVLKSVLHARQVMRKNGEDGLKFIFEVIQGSHWDKFPNGYSYVVMESLRKVYADNAETGNIGLVKNKLINHLILSSPTEIEAKGNNKYSNLGRTARWDAVLADLIA